MNAPVLTPDIEILAPGDGVNVLLQPKPFGVALERHSAPSGLNIEEIVATLPLAPRMGTYARVWIDSDEIPRSMWGKVRPKEGTNVNVKIMPRGGGDEGGKSTLALVLTLAVAVAAMVFGGPLGAALVGKGGTTIFGIAVSASAIGGAIITVVGTLLIAALVPPPKPPKPPQLSLDGLESPTNQITGVQNRLVPFAPIPRVFGKRRIFPMMAAKPLSEGQGKEQFVRLLLLVGYGPLRISELKIGETPISAFSGVETEIREGFDDDEPITLYTNQVDEARQSVTLETSGTPDDDFVLRTTEADTLEISVDLTFPGGLVTFDNKNNRLEREVTFDVQYRVTGSSTFKGAEWLNPEDKGFEVDGKVTANEKTTQAVFYSGRFRPEEGEGQYDVRIRRITPQTDDARVVDRVQWTMLRSIRNSPPINMTGLALIAIRMRATNQLNNIPDIINCIAESYLPVYDGAGGFTTEVTRNPAWAYLDVLRNRGDETIIPDSRIDLDGIKAWADDADATAPNASEPTWTFDAVLEGGSISETLQTIASHGRATPGMKDGKYSIVRDLVQAAPVQHISPRNSFGYRGKKSFVDVPHALKVRFVNAEKGFQEDERIVYRDGFNEDNATEFEVIESLGHTSATLVHREGRYNLAVLQLRPETHTVSMDIESLRCTRGDRVQFSHDVVSIGLASGRVKALTLDGSGFCEAIEVDEGVPMEAGKSYAMRVRFSDGSSNVITVNTDQIGVVTVLTVPTPLAPAATPEVGDHFQYGEADRESLACIIKEVIPTNDLTAQLVMFDYNEDIQAADQGPIPEHVSLITSDVVFGQERPEEPVIAEIRSDETVLFRAADGSLRERIRVRVEPVPTSTVRVAAIEFQLADAESGVFDQVKTVPANQLEVDFGDVEQGVAYDVRVRSVGNNFLNSEWVTESGHVVVGKTSLPSDVQGFAAIRKTEGAQLSWDDNDDNDLAGYELRQGDTFEASTLVAPLIDTNSFFVALDTTEDVTFFIRAVDVIGLKSEAAASLTVSLSPPPDVQAFDAFPDGDLVRFEWQRVGSEAFTYEIRQGSSFENGRVVGRSAGDSMTKKWPVKTAGTVTFFIRAISPSGLFSANSTSVSVTHDPLPDRNAVLEKDFHADSWPGVLHDFTVGGSGNLEVDQDSGVNAPFADYYADVALGASYYARNWIEMSLDIVTSADVTWDDLDDPWSGVTRRWDGDFVSADNAALRAFIAVEASLASNVTEMFGLDNSTTGENATAAATATNVTYQTCRYGDGALMGDFTVLDWAVTFASEWSLILDVRLDTVLSDDHVIVNMTGSGGIYLRLIYSATDDAYVLIDQDSNRLTVSPLREADDVLTFGISQSSTSRSLFAASRRYPTVQAASGDLAPVGSLTAIGMNA